MKTYRKRGTTGIPKDGFRVSEGGTKGLEFIDVTMLGKPQGVAQLDDKSQIPTEIVDIDLVDEYVSLSGPLSALKNVAAEYFITNYGFIREYDISSDYGLISRNGNIITFVPEYSGTVRFTVNKRVFEVYVLTEEIERPTIDQVGYSKEDSGSLFIKTSPLRTKTVSDTHKLSRVQGSKRANFDGNMVLNVTSNGVDPKYVQQGGVDYSGDIYLRAQHEGVVLGLTDWGEPRVYKKPQAIYPYMVVENFVNPSFDLLIPEGGYVHLFTDTGFEQIYYETQSVTLQLTCSKIITLGKGGKSTKEFVPPTGSTPGYYRDVEGPMSTLTFNGERYTYPGDPREGEEIEHKRILSNPYRTGNGTDGSFGKSTSLDSSGKRLVIGSPDGSWGGQLHVFEKHGQEFLPLTSWLASVPESSLQLSIAPGGSVEVFGEIYTSSEIIEVPEGVRQFTIKGTGGTGNTINYPGQPYIPPSDPIYNDEGEFVGYGDQGQPYVPPSSVNVQGDPTIVRLGSKNITFEGGNGGPATPVETHLSMDIKNIGSNVYISKNGRVVIAGAPNEIENTLEVGAIYEAATGYDPSETFPSPTGTLWTSLRRVISPFPSDGSRFGESVCSNFDGSRVFVGAPGENSVYYFKRSEGLLAFKQKIEGVVNTEFGESLVCSDNAEYLAVGAPLARSGQGSVRLFRTTDGESFNPLQTLDPSPSSSTIGYNIPDSGELTVEQFDGNGISLRKDSFTGSGNHTLEANTRRLECRGKGPSNSQSDTTLTFDGIPYIFSGANLGQALYTYCSIPRVQNTHGYGRVLDMSSDGNHIWAGVPEGDVSKPKEGFVIHFNRVDGFWVEQSRIACPKPLENGFFGQDVECSDNGLKASIGFPGNLETKGEVLSVEVGTKGNIKTFGVYYKEPGSLYGTGSEGLGSEVSISGQGDVIIGSNPNLSNGEGAVYAFNIN